MMTDQWMVIRREDDHPGSSRVCWSSGWRGIYHEGMRHPALHLAGIVASPSGGGGGIFGTGAEEELRKWLEVRLDALGIDPVAYSRFVLSLLRRPDSVFSPCDKPGAFAKSGCRQYRAPTRPPPTTDREQKRAVIQCLVSAADQKCGVESLVDELCLRLRELEGGGSDDKKDDRKKLDGEPKMALESLTPRDRALRYYAAFPALQPATPKKFSHKKDRISINNNNTNNCSNINNKARSNKKTKMSIAMDTGTSEEKDTSYGFAKSMEKERDRERELALDQLRLAQLQAKFDQSLEALWDSGPGNAQDTASIWAAPSLSIPSGPLWPSDPNEAPFLLPLGNNGRNVMETPYQESMIDDSPLIPWDIDLIDVGDYEDEPGNKDKTEYNSNWSNSIAEGPWAWRELGGSLATLGHSSQTGSCFMPVGPCKTPVKTEEEIRPSHEVVNLQEPDEDLLTSARTHFRPIKEDGHWADGTTFPVNNSIERIAYRRSDSGHLLYLPGGESPYMEYRERTSPSSAPKPATLTLKFRVRQCDKCVQTEPVRSPAKRRIISNTDHFYYSPNRDEESDILKVPETTQIEKHCFTFDQLGWIQQRLPLHNDRKRRHSSSLRCRPLAALRPLTL
ncbi:uncharacterized protein LOC124413466 isoform X1 [Diprion similis]|uniref:uncharacterized protein LOC124413466 isoform X1 n=3 Tax=Diprion similis TaxID=362088 RepID=UPI001EF8F08F|nr:uncharacterized protein LOC124413466 isoform X1 [Diprion similis]